jgi:hypothetical protein
MNIVVVIVLVTQMLLSSACGGKAPQAPALQEAPAVATQAPPTATEAPPTATEAPPTETAVPTQPEVQGTVVADIGFRPEVDGFSFPNYGAEFTDKNLTEVEMRRMFGDQVCALLENDKCTLTPPAKQWMELQNGDMGGGHCDGFATLSLLMFSGEVNPDAFGAAKITDLSPQDEKLQHELAYWWATQITSPEVESRIYGTPNDILELLLNETASGELYTIDILKRDKSGGHAITPFGVIDMGGGIYEVGVYDNNFPGERRSLTIDSNANTWKYEGSINPQVASDLYEGDAETRSMFLAPVSPRLSQQTCTFCAPASAASLPDAGGNARLASRVGVTPERYNQFYLDGEGHLLIFDGQGRRLGFVDGEFVNEIPGAQSIDIMVGDIETDSPEPEYWIPDGISVTVRIDGSTLKEASSTDLVIIGPGYSVGVEGISLDPDQVDDVVFDAENNQVVYMTKSSESPNIVTSIEQPGKADYYFEVQGTDIQGGGNIQVYLDTKQNYLVIGTHELKTDGTFNLYLTRIDEDEEFFAAEDLAMKSGAMMFVDYGQWKGNGSGLMLLVDTNGDGQPDESYEAQDMAK